MPQFAEGLTARNVSAADATLGKSNWANGWDVAVKGSSEISPAPSPVPGSRGVCKRTTRRPLPSNYSRPPSRGGISGELGDLPRKGLQAAERTWVKIVTWLILPVVICLSQRLSHACLSISNYTVKLRMAH